ncbi:CHAT domain-containing protein [uncultured Aquimarina sp.]|uniref:CHAT domain-containing protein n=1 Tax=uncultured Aquimarina sp. TaxID=575652 RepID=UPI00261EC977|nr:CHAT domain-containing protein [uncultured Aquimarina sp.]
MIRNLILYFFLWLTTLICNAQQISSALDSIHQLNPEDDYGNIHLYDSLITYYKKTKNYTQLGSDAHQLAKWLVRENQWDKGIEIIETGIAARKKAAPFNPELLKRSYVNLGNYYTIQKKYTKAIQAYENMLNIKESTIFNGLSYTRLGVIYKKLEDPHLAVEHYSKAFELYHPEKDKKRIITNHIRISEAYSSQKIVNNANKSLHHLLAADSLIKTQKKPKLIDLYSVNLNLGAVYTRDFFLNHEKALHYFKEALKQALELNNERSIGISYINMGFSNLELNKIEASNNCFAKSLDYLDDSIDLRAPYFLGLAFIASKQENYNLAQKFYQKSLADILNYQGSIESWTPESKSLQTSNNKEDIIELFYFKIVDYLKQVKLENNDDIYAEILKTVRLSDSLINYMTVEDFSYDTKLLSRDLESEINIMGLEACHQTNDLETAFYLMEKSKAVLLMFTMNDQSTSLPHKILSNKVNYKNAIEDLQSKVLIAIDKDKDSLIKLLNKEKEQYSILKDSLSAKYPDDVSNNKIPKILELSEVEVPENEIIIQYAMAERRAGELPHAYMLVFAKDSQKMFKISNIKTLIDNIKTLRKLLNQPFTTAENIITYKKTSNDIYKSLFPEEIRAVLKGKKVTIIPDHMLGMIPFEALVTNLDNNTYLIEDCEIDYAFSLTFQQQNAKISRTAAQDFLGIAPVNFKQELTPLQNSNKEITAANAFYNGDLLLDQEATKENFIKKIKDYKILHLATHADASDSIAPWIAFRNSKLTDLELNLLQSQAELVVLSACNTSLGKISRGEGVLSLARGFFKSGANTVIPSLWSTNDKATATITADFYKNLSEGQTKSAALRTAKLNYLQSNTDAEASPHYWASMILIGDTGTLLPQSNDLWMLWIGLVAVLLLCLVYFLVKKTR